MTEQHWWCRVECDARIVRKKLERRKAGMGYMVTGWGEQMLPDFRSFPTVTLVAQIIAPTREAALAQLIRDCPGCVVTISQPGNVKPPKSGRFVGLTPFKAWQPMVFPAQIERAEIQLRQIELHSEAHKRWMAANKRKGRTDDEAAAQLHRDYPWPRVSPCYTVGGRP